MARAEDMHTPDAAANESFAARLKQEYGEGVDPEVSLDRPASGAQSGASSELLRRLADHGLKQTRYRVEGELARGGMGAILRVWDEDLRRTLAMKVILGKLDPPAGGATPAVDPRTLGRFLEEAQVTGQLDHPGIVPVHELGLDSEGRVYFTMKLVKGRDLKQIFDLVFAEREGWNVTRALGVLLKACEAMAYAHAKGVIHRDLKPANVMVGSFGEVYVMDWGLARVLGRKDSHDIRISREFTSALRSIATERRDAREESPDSPIVTMDGDVMGTPAYMPPEQARGEVEKLSPRSDVYAMGAMLYHLLAGQMPYVPPGARVSHRTVLMAVVHGPPKPVHEIHEDVPAELEAICEKAMAREQERRYADTLALAEDLRAYLEHRVVAAYETGALAEFKKWVSRNRALAASIGLAIFTTVAGLASIVLIDHFASRRLMAARSEAEANYREAEAGRQEILRLSDLKRLDGLLAGADALWPSLPARIASCESWLSEAETLASRLDLHREHLEELRSAALPLAQDELERYLAADARAEELERMRRQWSEIRARAGRDPAGVPAPGSAIAEESSSLLRRIVALARVVRTPRRWSFATPEVQWQHDTLLELVSRLEGFVDPDPARGRIADVRARARFARTIEERSVSGARVRASWDVAIGSIRDPAECPHYGALAIAPQVGLVPIGRDRESGLWEFAHLASGEPAERGADGKLVSTEATGIVLVLLPGGTFVMGAQSGDANRASFDPQAGAHESPVHEVTLAPFFLSKYEMTQAQWERFTGANPSYHAAGALHPVEQVSWFDCRETMRRLDLALPTEAQWEFGCRAGTGTIWCTGDAVASLAGFANIADEGSAGSYSAGWRFEPGFRDGFAAHGPVGSYSPNAFGLHDVVGNVWEWCRDGYGSYELPARAKDGERGAVDAPLRANRGGGFYSLAAVARSAARDSDAPDVRHDGLGLRPARELALP